ncbi:MAG: glucoamylase family protein [Bacteroidia bacterium]
MKSAKFSLLVIIFISAIISSCKKEQEQFLLTWLRSGTLTLSLDNTSSNVDVPVDEPIVATFSSEVNEASVAGAFTLSQNGNNIPLTFDLIDNNKTISATPQSNLQYNQTYSLQITHDLKSSSGKSFTEVTVPFITKKKDLKIDSLSVDGVSFFSAARLTNINRNFPAIIKFNLPLDTTTITAFSVRVAKSGASASLQFSYSDSNKTLHINATQPLSHFEKYELNLSNSIHGKNGSIFSGYKRIFYSALDTTPKFPVLTDDDLLTEVEHQTFKYFWDFAHPVSGLTPERESTPNVVTIGGSGFGVMSILVGIQRNFITRQQGVDRLQTIVSFLQTANRFHGAWPHWMNGTTGQVIPFSPNDNGADLVETSYMIQGLLTVRQFLNASDQQENMIKQKIDTLWREVEWDWFTQGGQNVLYWHWSPNLGWAMNMQIKGYNECLITYFLASSSPTHPITASVYHQGWAVSSNMINGNTYYGYTLPLGYPYGGPLFFSHYSFLGFDPRNLSDQYANYETQNTNHTLINRAYCIANPLNYFGYSAQCWGLTSSDNQSGYDAHSPTNDLGVITPTAAIASIVYTPQNSIDAIKFFYYTLGDKLWGQYGFYDAFNATNGWYGTSYLAIDQGPQVIMIENYRTQMLWNLFMSAPEVTVGMNTLGFVH